MSRPNANTFRLLAMLALFLASVFSHGIAIADASVPRGIPAIHAAIAADHDRAPCDTDHCGGGRETCCVSGQCALGVPSPATFAFREASRHVPSGSSLVVSSNAASGRPFRPPASV